MKQLLALSSFLILLATTIGVACLQGALTNRWGPQPDATQAAAAMRNSLPTNVGNWRVRDESEFPEDVVRMLQCPAHISRVYEHQQTGDQVNLTVVLGPPGPISVHTPEVCYSSRDYTLDGERRVFSLPDQLGNPQSFWEVPLKANDLQGVALRVLYGWSSGTKWEAAEHPRFGYGGLTHLYKLQMAVAVHNRSQHSEFDPAQDFLYHFLAQLQPRLVEASR